MGERIRPVSAARARRVRDIVIEHFRSYTHDEHGSLLPEDELPVLREPGTGWGDHWVLAWEGGSPYDWPTGVTDGLRSEYAPYDWKPGPELPREVFCEPINGIELGIYPPHQW